MLYQDFKNKGELYVELLAEKRKLRVSLMTNLLLLWYDYGL